jgi:hypothetical protein
MKAAKYFNSNQNRVATLTDDDWRVALKKCKEHIKWRLKQKTLSGAHSSSNLGSDPIEHYLGLSYEKILLGEWEWKQEFSISEQMIRIVDSCVSKEIEKTTTNKSDLFKLIYIDIEQEFYDLTDPPETTLEKNVNEAILQSIETAVSGDEQLEFIVEALKEGKKRTEIADLLDIKPRQFDKLREKLIRRINNPQPSPK